MSDIVEWLRASCARTTVIDIKRLDEAADEITRLREALREIAEENIGNTAAISVYIARAALGGELE